MFAEDLLLGHGEPGEGKLEYLLTAEQLELAWSEGAHRIAMPRSLSSIGKFTSGKGLAAALLFSRAMQLDLVVHLVYALKMIQILQKCLFAILMHVLDGLRGFVGLLSLKTKPGKTRMKCNHPVKAVHKHQHLSMWGAHDVFLYNGFWCPIACFSIMAALFQAKEKVEKVSHGNHNLITIT